MRRAPLFLLLFLLFCSGCGYFKAAPPVPEVPEGGMVRLSTDAYPRFSDDMDYKDLETAVSRSLHYFRKLPKERSFSFAGETCSRDRMIESLTVFMGFIQTRPSVEELNRFIASRYVVYQSVGRDSKREVLFTGYYEPLLAGSPTRTAKYDHPVYGAPDDIITVDLSRFSSKYGKDKIVGRVSGKNFLPYYDRKEIEKGALDGKAKILAWVSDPIGLFFLQIQGSGKVRFENGTTLQVNYHSVNGRPYASIGQKLIDQGKITVKDMSMQAIRDYLTIHPEEQEEIFFANPSYVFFKTEEDGPFGCLSEKLTPGRSVAVDRGLFPMAGLTFVQAKKPLLDDRGKIAGWVDCPRFVLPQDTGGAIKGAGRVDMFWGNGPYAETVAGYMKHPGALFFLVLKP